MTPPSIRALALSRMDKVRQQISEIETSLTPLRAELAELTTWLDTETAPTAAPTLTLLQPSPPLPAPQGKRVHTAPVGFVRGQPRPSRVRADGSVEMWFPRGSYSTIAIARRIGTIEDANGVWLTRDEWASVLDEARANTARRKAAR